MQFRPDLVLKSTAKISWVHGEHHQIEILYRLIKLGHILALHRPSTELIGKKLQLISPHMLIKHLLYSKEWPFSYTAKHALDWIVDMGYWKLQQYFFKRFVPMKTMEIIKTLQRWYRFTDYCSYWILNSGNIDRNVFFRTYLYVPYFNTKTSVFMCRCGTVIV